MKLKNLAVLIIAAIMTVMLYALGATVYSQGTDAQAGSAHSHSGWTALTADNISDIAEGGNFYLSTNLTVTNAITINSGSTVNLCLAGNTLNLSSRSITVPSGAELNIYDDAKTIDGNGTITSTERSHGPIYNNGGTLTVNGGNIKGMGNYGIHNNNSGTVTINGAVAYIYGKLYGIYNQNGNSAEIINATVEGDTAGIENINTYLIVDGANINSLATSNNSYGIRNKSSGSTTSTTAYIKNRASVSGISGGILNQNLCVLTVENSTIEGEGGGLSNAGQATVTGTTIRAISSGYGINNSTSSQFLTVDSCDVIGFSRGIYNTGIISVKGGTITGRTDGFYDDSGMYSVEFDGVVIENAEHGINVVSNHNNVPTIEIQNITIENCDYGIYNDISKTICTVNIKEAYIDANKYGIYNYNNSSLSIKIESGTISGNECGISTTGSLTIKGGDINGYGTYGVYIGGSGSLTITNGNVSGKINGVRLGSFGSKLYLSEHPNINCTGADSETDNSDIYSDIYIAKDAYIDLIGELTDSPDYGTFPYIIYAAGAPCDFTRTVTDAEAANKETANQWNQKAFADERFKAVVREDYEYAVSINTSTKELRLGNAVTVTFDYNDGDEEDVKTLHLTDDDMSKVVCENDPYGTLPSPYEFIALDAYQEDIDKLVGKGFYRPGYEFSGWYNNPGCTGDKITATTTVPQGAASYVLYAKWVPCGHFTVEKGTKKWEKYWTNWEKLDNYDHRHTCMICRDVEKTEHDWKDLEETEAGGLKVTHPTCTSGGEVIQYCSTCGAYKADKRSANGHLWSGALFYIDDGNIDDEYHWEKCMICDAKLKSKHTLSISNVIDPTCMMEGSEDVECLECMYSAKGRTIPVDKKNGHAWDTDPQWKADTNHLDHNHDGHWYICTNTDLEGKRCDEKKDFVSHKWEGDGYTVVTKESTCTVNGSITSTCDVCTEKNETMLELAPHTPDGDWHKDKTDHWHECTVCGKDYDKANHIFSSLEETVPGDCYTKTKYIYACECGATEEREGDYVHDFGDNWVYIENGVENTQQHWKECLICGKKDENKENHSAASTERQEPTYEEEGKITYTCKCGYEWSKTIPKLDPPGETTTTSKDVDDTDPKETDPTETDPKETDPKETDPKETDPKETDPKETDPSETDPKETDPKETDPKETDPSETDPKETDPKETDPKETDPKETDPKETDSSETEPTQTDPSETDPDTPTIPPVEPTPPEVTTNTDNPDPDITTDPDNSNSGDDETSITTITPEETTSPTETTSKTTSPTTVPPIVTTTSTTPDPTSSDDSGSSTDPSQGTTDNGSGGGTSTGNGDSTGTDNGNVTGTGTGDGTNPPDNGDNTGSDNTIGSDGNNESPGTDLGSGKVIVKVEVKEGAPDISMDMGTVSSLEHEVVEKHISDEERAAIESGSNMEIILIVTSLSINEDVSDEDRYLTETFLNNSTYEAGEYLDVSVIKLLNGVQVGKITRLNAPITITFDIPEALRKENRSFAMVRIHSGSADLLYDLDSDPDTITIQSDKFSTYVIVYRDNADSENIGSGTNGINGNPNTGSPLTSLAILAFALPIGVLAAIFNKNREK